jgi:hypothetical protein
MIDRTRFRDDSTHVAVIRHRAVLTADGIDLALPGVKVDKEFLTDTLADFGEVIYREALADAVRLLDREMGQHLGLSGHLP